MVAVPCGLGMIAGGLRVNTCCINQRAICLPLINGAVFQKDMDGVVVSNHTQAEGHLHPWEFQVTVSQKLKTLRLYL